MLIQSTASWTNDFKLVVPDAATESGELAGPVPVVPAVVPVVEPLESPGEEGALVLVSTGALALTVKSLIVFPVCTMVAISGMAFTLVTTAVFISAAFV